MTTKSSKVINSLWFICLDENSNTDQISKRKVIKEALNFIYPYTENLMIFYGTCNSLFIFDLQ